MPRLMLCIALLLLWNVVAVQAEHEPEIPPQCTAAHQAVKNAQGQVDVPVIPDSMSREEQKALIKAWKAQRQPAIDAANEALATCKNQHRR